MQNRTRAHRTGFQCAVQVATFEPVIAQRNPSGSQRNDLRVGGWVAVRNHSVPAGSNNRSGPHDHSAHWHFALSLRQPSF